MEALKKFTLFSSLPYELRRTIWLLTLPSPSINLTFTSYSGSVILSNHASYTSSTFHINRESRATSLSQCALLYNNTQPILTDLSRAYIILKTGTMWNLLTLGQILSDERTTTRKFAIYSDVILNCMVHNRTSWPSTFGASSTVVNFFAPFYKFSLEAGLGRDDVVTVVHKKWNLMLVNDVDVEKVKIRWGDHSGGFKMMFDRILGRGEGDRLDELPRVEHVLDDDFQRMCGETGAGGGGD